MTGSFTLASVEAVRDYMRSGAKLSSLLRSIAFRRLLLSSTAYRDAGVLALQTYRMGT